MTSFTELTVNRAINKNSTLSVTITSPPEDADTILIEGKDIVVPLFGGIVFSGSVIQVNKRILTRSDGTMYYVWSLDAVSDEYKLSNDEIPESKANSYNIGSAGTLLTEYLGSTWAGDIDTSGPTYQYMTPTIDKGSVADDFVSQTKYDFRTRRNYSRYIAEYYIPGTTSYIGYGGTAADLSGKTLVFVDGEGAYKTYGNIISNNYLEIEAQLENPYLPEERDRFIVVLDPVVDFKPAISNPYPVATFIVNKTILDFEGIDDKSGRYTKVICTGTSYQDQPISSSIPAIYSDWSNCSYTTYRGDGVLHAPMTGILDTSSLVVLVKGHQFKPEPGEQINIFYANVKISIVVYSTEFIYSPDGAPITKVNIDTMVVYRTAGIPIDTVPAGVPVFYSDWPLTTDIHAKIYVENPDLFDNGKVWVGEELITFGDVGEDVNGKYLTLITRGAGGTTPYNHPIGTMVRPYGPTEDSPQPGSPFDTYGKKLRIVQNTGACSKGDLDRLATTLIPQGSNIIKSGEGTIPVPYFWKVDARPDHGQTPLEPGDTVAVTDGVSTTNYSLLSYKIDFDKMTVRVRLGDAAQSLALNVQGISQTIGRKIS